MNITAGSNVSSSFGSPPLVGTILYSTISSLSLILNIFVVFLLIRSNRLLRNPHNRCILSLATTDIIASISVLTNPDFVLGESFYNTRRHNPVTRELYCRVIWNKYLTYALTVTSVYTSVVLSFERWLAVRRSVFYKKRFTIFHMNLLIIASWISGLMAGVPNIFFVEGAYERPTESCRFVLATNKLLYVFLSTVQFLFQVIIPLTFIILAYIGVFRGIKTSLRFAASARIENINAFKRMKKVTEVAAITTIVVVVFWVPNNILYFISLLVHEPVDGHNNPLVTFVTLLTLCNGCINPCIYVFSNPDLRKAVKDICRQQDTT